MKAAGLKTYERGRRRYVMPKGFFIISKSMGFSVADISMEIPGSRMIFTLFISQQRTS